MPVLNRLEIENVSVHALASCGGHCSSTTDCKAILWSPNTNKCWLDTSSPFAFPVHNANSFCPESEDDCLSYMKVWSGHKSGTRLWPLMLRVFMRMLFGLCRRSCGIRRSNNIRPEQAGAIAGEPAEFGGSPTSRKIATLKMNLMKA